MQQKRMTLHIVATAAFIILSLLFVLWFSARSRGPKPRIELPENGEIHVGENLTPALLNDPGAFLPYAMTAENAAAQLALLRTPEQYTLELRAELVSGDTASVMKIRTVRTPGRTYCAVEQNGQTECFIRTADTLYGWVGGSARVRTFAAGDFPEQTLTRLPALSDLITDAAAVTEAEYVQLGDTWTVRLRLNRSETLTDQVWIAIDSGLVLHMERSENGVPVQKVTIVSQDFGDPDDSVFTLPDGTRVNGSM